MMQRRCALLSLSLPTLLLVLADTAGEAHAQAWVGPARSLDVSLDYNLGSSDKVIGEGDVEFPNAGTTSHQMSVGAEYAPIDKLAVSVSLPLLFIKYTGAPGTFDHPGGGRYDDGDYHGTLTDLRTTVRYQVLDGVVALSPHLGLTVPVADYETIGNAVAGRHLVAGHLGLSVGKVFLDAAYVHFMYEFTLAQKYDRTADTEQYSQNRSDFAATVGYQLLEGKLDLNLSGNVRLTHDGVTFNDFGMFTPDEMLYHDAILKEEIFLVGAGVGYRLTDVLTAGIAGRLFVSGNNTQNASVLGLSLSWSPQL